MNAPGKEVIASSTFKGQANFNRSKENGENDKSHKITDYSNLSHTEADLNLSINEGKDRLPKLKNIEVPTINLDEIRPKIPEIETNHLSNDKSIFIFKSQLFGGFNNIEKGSAAPLNVISYLEKTKCSTAENSEEEQRLPLKERKDSSPLIINSKDDKEDLNDIQINDVIEVFCEHENCFRKAKVIQIKSELDVSSNCVNYPQPQQAIQQKLFYIHYLDYEKRMDNWIPHSLITRKLSSCPESANPKLAKSNSKNSFIFQFDSPHISSLSQANIMLTRKRSNYCSNVMLFD